MASLIIQDTFEPYYAERDDDAGARTRPAARAKKPEPMPEADIVLPDEAPAYVPTVRRDRRPVMH